jgi:inosine-uridine nucleoside N-ribohydrolase
MLAGGRGHGLVGPWPVGAALLAALLIACTTITSPPASGGLASVTGNASPPAASAATATRAPGSRLRLVIDTDMAPDDVVAIASLLRDPGVEILAINVVGTGEAHCPGGMFVARAVVTMLRDEPVPVACGRTTPLDDAEPFPAEWRAGADAGNGLRLVSPAFLPDERSADDLLAELAAAEAAAGRKLTVLTLGPLTNLAVALADDSTLADRLRVISMLGAVAVPGNVQTTPGVETPLAEWNAHADPTAVRQVLESGVDLTLIPLDATNSTPLTADLYRTLESDHASGPADLVYELWSRNTFMVEGDYYLWDPVAAAAVGDPSLVTTRAANLRVVEGAGPDGGQLLEDPAGAPVTIAIGADRPRFEARLLASLRTGPPRASAFSPVAVVGVIAGPETCDVAVDPPSPPAGLLRIELASSASEPLGVLVFEVAGVPWSDLEAFAREPDFEHPPAINQVAAAFLEGSGSMTGWGESREGPLGVACVFGNPDDAASVSIVLAGPYDLAD